MSSNNKREARLMKLNFGNLRKLERSDIFLDQPSFSISHTENYFYGTNTVLSNRAENLVDPEIYKIVFIWFFYELQ